MLLSFSVSLWFFNRGDIFTAVPLAYPGLVWLLARCLWIGRSDRAPRGTVVWPVWVLVGATVFLGGFRIGLNVRASNVIDVGYAGVIGADRIRHGESPYGHFPVEGDRPKCGPADAAGEVRERIQTNGRCESANEQRRHLRPGLVPGLPARLPGVRLEREVGHAAGRARDLDPLGSALPASDSRSSGGGSEGLDSAPRSPSRGSRGRSRSTPRARTRTT